MKKLGRKLFAMVILGMLLISFTSYKPVSAETGTFAQYGAEEPLDSEPRNQRVSVASDGTVGNDFSYNPFISGDGRFVLFTSNANNLVPNDTNYGDVFVHDRVTAITERVSISSNGIEANASAFGEGISYDGRFVIFTSMATNLVNNDTNEFKDVFLHDRQTHETILISKSFDGSQTNETSDYASISSSGQYVVFSSNATNLVENDTNESPDIFIYDHQTEEIEIIPLAFDDPQREIRNVKNLSVSTDGRYIAFQAVLWKANEVNQDNIFVHDRLLEETRLVSVSSEGVKGDSWSINPEISANGQFVSFTSDSRNLVENDTNRYRDIFVHDLISGITERVSIATDGTEGNGSAGNSSISSDGRYVVFDTRANNLYYLNGYSITDGVYLRDRLTGTTEMISLSPGGIPIGQCFSYVTTGRAGISDDGTYVTYSSRSNGLVLDNKGTTYEDVFVTNRNGQFIVDPEISVYPSGWGILIENGDTTPNSEDFTDFGYAMVSETTKSNRFDIVNIGVSPLTLTGDPTITITGEHAQDFFVSDFPDNSIYNPGGSSDFIITFSPSATGLRKAVVNIQSDDTDNNPYTFTIQGEGVPPILTEGVYDDSYPGIEKFDGWNTIDYEYFFQGTYSITNHAEARATFYGVGVSVRYVKDDNLQDMEIYIDDVLQVTIDESNNPDRPYLNNKEIGEWYSDVLPLEEHVLRLVPTESSTIGFDKITVIGETEALPKTPALISPGGTKDTNNPLFVWYATERATGYWLTVGRSSDGTYLFNSYVTPNTNSYTCWLNLPVSLSNGDYWFKVTAGNDSGWGDASAQMDFSVSVSQPPEAPTLISPDGSIDTNNPLFVWYAAENANGYWLTVGRSSDGAYLFNSYVQPNTNGYTCWLNLPVSLSNGDYWFKVTAGNDSGWGDVSAQMAFSVSVSQPPDAPSLLSPSGTVNTDNPLFVWYSTANASGYWLTVRRSSDGAYLFNSYVIPYTNGYTCWLNLPVTFANGNYWFKITAGNASGWGDASAKMEFVIDQ